MDRIVVLDAGRIAEQGSHAELPARAGLYARLWTFRSGGFIDCASVANDRDVKLTGYNRLREAPPS